MPSSKQHGQATLGRGPGGAFTFLRVLVLLAVLALFFLVPLVAQAQGGEDAAGPNVWVFIGTGVVGAVISGLVGAALVAAFRARLPVLAPASAPDPTTQPTVEVAASPGSVALLQAEFEAHKKMTDDRIAALKASHAAQIDTLEQLLHQTRIDYVSHDRLDKAISPIRDQMDKVQNEVARIDKNVTSILTHVTGSAVAQ